MDGFLHRGKARKGERREGEEEEEDGKRFSRDSWHAASRFVDRRSMETRRFPIPPRSPRPIETARYAPLSSRRIVIVDQ